MKKLTIFLVALLCGMQASATDLVLVKSDCAQQSENIADYQTFTLDQWSKLEEAGAVFLPASGGRNGSNVNRVQDCGDYWSATHNVMLGEGNLAILSNSAGTDYGYREYGRAVRLVKDVQ